MIRLKFSVALNYDIAEPGSDFIFSVHAAQTPHQRVVNEVLSISQPLPRNAYTDPVTHTRYDVPVGASNAVRDMQATWATQKG